MSALARRLVLVPPTLLGITLVTFLLVHLAPGDPAEVRAGQGRGVSAESIAAYRRAYGLDRPLGARYLAWLERSARLDFGESLPDAVGGKRFHHQWRPNLVSYGKGLDPRVIKGLRERGHNVEELESAGRTQAIGVGPDGKLIGVADPRGGGKAAGE